MNQFYLPPRCSRCLAEEAPESWCIAAQMRERGEGDRPIDTVKRVFVPLCEACYHTLARRRRRVWLAGTAAGTLACGLAPLLAPQIDCPLSIAIGGAAGAWLPVVCFTTYALQQLFVTRGLAVYEPAKPRLRFANGQYQQLFDQANQFVAKKQNSLGV